MGGGVARLPQQARILARFCGAAATYAAHAFVVGVARAALGGLANRILALEALHALDCVGAALTEGSGLTTRALAANFGGALPIFTTWLAIGDEAIGVHRAGGVWRAYTAGTNPLRHPALGVRQAQGQAGAAHAHFAGLAVGQGGAASAGLPWFGGAGHGRIEH